ncbi:M23 family metallopeptidase [Novosphingobium sp.]|uniref:M23 family metallopeptidase n=1 Tax=Novosphingobium sp. TaxID=1874826 RepID=UPI00352690F2
MLAALAAGFAPALAGWRADAATAVDAAGPLDLALTGELTQGGWARGTAPRGVAALSLDGRPVAIAPDGQFLLAFDRDAAGRAELAVRFADGRTMAQPLTIAPRAWQIERVGVGLRPGTAPSAEWAARRAGELAQIKAARSVDNPAQGWRQRFIWPVQGRLSGRFGSQRIYNGTPGSYHSGLDIATGTSGTPFVAPADGVVILAAQSPFSLEGRLLMIDHGMGLNSAFLHCSELAVKVGDTVRQGQTIGRIGATGRVTGPHLHWSIKWRDSRLDPLLFTGPMPSR